MINLKKQIILTSIVGLIALSFISSANGQKIYDGIAEDQIIMCVNGHVIEQSGNICKVFNVDDQSMLDAQEELYKNPDSDTFNMDVRD